MSKAFARGACPGLSAPMQTGDGLLARLVPAGPIPLDAFVGLCEAARAHGNGIMEISARGSIQDSRAHVPSRRRCLPRRSRPSVSIFARACRCSPIHCQTILPL